jgi:multisubunit Na+/H+ antiporter MnhB subunit
VKSLLLQELAALILPLSIMFGIALTLKGHDAPGGGFVGGLSLAVAGVLGFSAWGTRAFRARVPFSPERVALTGALLLLGCAALPLPAGEPMLTQHSAAFVLPLLGKVKLQSALLFDAGVVMVVGGGLATAAIWLWDLAAVSVSARPEKGRDE